MTYDGAVERQVLGARTGGSAVAGAGRGARYSRARRAGEGYRSPMRRFLGLSLTTHALLLLAGLTGGAAYVRRSGADHPPASFSFPINSVSEPSAAVAEASAEPVREIEKAAASAEAEVVPVEAASEDESPAQASWEALASVAPSRGARETQSLDKLLGDPRGSWRLPGGEAPGLHLGAADESPVSDCCGEPQPLPQKPPADDIYIYPEVVSMAQAKFPLKSQRLGEDGTVLLEMTVGADGLVKDVRVAQSSGYRRIDDCAVAAAWDWIFKPATRNGVAEVSLARHRYTFRLTGSGG